jgi:hypothetical protein
MAENPQNISIPFGKNVIKNEEVRSKGGCIMFFMAQRQCPGWWFNEYHSYPPPNP